MRCQAASAPSPPPTMTTSSSVGFGFLAELGAVDVVAPAARRRAEARSGPPPRRRGRGRSGRRPAGSRPRSAAARSARRRPARTGPRRRACRRGRSAAAGGRRRLPRRRSRRSSPPRARSAGRRRRGRRACGRPRRGRRGGRRACPRSRPEGRAHRSRSGRFTGEADFHEAWILLRWRGVTRSCAALLGKQLAPLAKGRLRPLRHCSGAPSGAIGSARSRVLCAAGKVKKLNLICLTALPLLLCAPGAGAGAGRRAGATPAAAPARLREVDFSADQLSYDSEADIVTASGDVRMISEGNKLRADRVTWNRSHRRGPRRGQCPGRQSAAATPPMATASS